MRRQQVCAPTCAVPAIAALVALAADTGQPPPAPAWRDLLLKLTGIDLARCRVCGRGNVVRYPLPENWSQPPSPVPAVRDTSPMS